MTKIYKKSQPITADSKTQDKIISEISKFRKKIHKKYNIRLYVSIPKFKKNCEPIISLDDFWNIVIEVIAEDRPHLIKYTNFKSKTRLREWMLYSHSFAFIAKTQLDHGVFDIGVFMNKTHASVINSITKAENAIWIGYADFLKVYNKLDNKLKEYVGTISKDTKV